MDADSKAFSRDYQDLLMEIGRSHLGPRVLKLLRHVKRGS